MSRQQKSRFGLAVFLGVSLKPENHRRLKLRARRARLNVSAFLDRFIERKLK